MLRKEMASSVILSNNRKMIVAYKFLIKPGTGIP